MEPTKELIDELYRQDIRHARSMTEDEKLRLSVDLFDIGLELVRSGIRSQHPDADAGTVERLLDERLALGRRLEAAN
jgi:hypothetical protein